MDCVLCINGVYYQTKGLEGIRLNKGDVFEIRVFNGQPMLSSDYLYQGKREKFMVDEIIYTRGCSTGKGSITRSEKLKYI